MKYGHGVKGVRPLEGYTLRVVFNDGFVGTIDLEPLFKENTGPLTEPFKDPAFFRKVDVDPECEVVCWSNGYDICSDVLRYYCEIGRVSSREEMNAYFAPAVRTSESPLALKDEPGKTD